MNIVVTIEVWQKEKWFIAKCPELDFIAQGNTSDEAKQNLLEVLQIQMGEMEDMGTLNEYLAECGYEKHNDKIVQSIEMIGFEKFSLQVA